jgi:hypothetical protein
MTRYTLNPIQNVSTFKCVVCGMRGKPEEAYNLTVAACSSICFERAFNLFMEANGYSVYQRSFVLDAVKANSVPLY